MANGSGDTEGKWSRHLLSEIVAVVSIVAAGIALWSSLNKPNEQKFESLQSQVKSVKEDLRGVTGRQTQALADISALKEAVAANRSTIDAERIARRDVNEARQRELNHVWTEIEDLKGTVCPTSGKPKD